MSRKQHPVEFQKLDDVKGNEKSYGDYIEAHDGLESELANPDLLPEQTTAPSTPQLIMGEAIEHLQGRQREVYLCVMREDMTQEETGELLGISQPVVWEHLNRAIAFITAYCHRAEEKGRI